MVRFGVMGVVVQSVISVTSGDDNSQAHIEEIPKEMLLAIAWIIWFYCETTYGVLLLTHGVGFTTWEGRVKVNRPWVVEIERPQLLKLYDETLIKWGLNDSNGFFFIKMNMLNIKGRGKGIKTFIGI